MAPFLIELERVLFVRDAIVVSSLHPSSHNRTSLDNKFTRHDGQTISIYLELRLRPWIRSRHTRSRQSPGHSAEARRLHSRIRDRQCLHIQVCNIRRKPRAYAYHVYRDQIRENVLVKQYYCDVDIAHLISYDEELAHKLNTEPAEILPLVR